ncbi:hypothetical protein L484_012177 [Morus notabilis]|uniref:Uncharacterized protein n=1 Tax=Morus notabilis TaxID=981085 RepID=W9RGN2_9ROSA|nr:hypothetical protein L484_012177 [Morus notabilis]
MGTATKREENIRPKQRRTQGEILKPTQQITCNPIRRIYPVLEQQHSEPSLKEKRRINPPTTEICKMPNLEANGTAHNAARSFPSMT